MDIVLGFLRAAPTAQLLYYAHRNTCLDFIFTCIHTHITMVPVSGVTLSGFMGAYYGPNIYILYYMYTYIYYIYIYI